MSTLLEQLAGFWLGMTNHLWQCTLIGGCLVFFDWFLRRAPASVRADLWTLGMVKVCLPAALGGALVAALSAHWATEIPVLDPLIVTVLTPALSDPGSITGWWGPVLLLGTLVWLGGFGFQLLGLARDLRFQSGLVRDAHPVTEACILEAARGAGVPRDRILVAPRVSLPLVKGWLNPQILIPSHLAHILSPLEFETLLRHEDHHRRRRDPLLMLISRLLVAVFWFYPPLTWLLRRLHECSEYACDEAALAGHADAKQYLRAMARAIQRGLDPAPPLVASMGGGGGNLMRRRLARLGREKGPTMKYGRLVMLAAVAVVAVAVFVPLEIVAKEPPAPPVAPEPPVPQVVEQVPVVHAAPVVEPVPAVEPVMEPVPIPAEVAVPAAVPMAESNLKNPVLIKFESPEYPEEARKNGVGGTVVVKIMVGEDGVPLKVKLAKGVDGSPELGKAALAAARHCRFEPATQDGQPVVAWVALPYEFTTQ